MIRLRRLWTSLRSSLWFVPALMVACAVGLAAVLVSAEGILGSELVRHHPRLFGADASGSREMLSAIASSMITVAGVTFSLTLVAITQASSQYTPRVLRNYMGDRVTQLFLGYFVAVFAYALVVLRTIRSGEEDPFVPSAAVLAALVLAVASVGILILFVHRIAGSIQASTIISSIAGETAHAIDNLFPEELGEAEEEEPAASVSQPQWKSVPASDSGYIQDIDSEKLLAFAEEQTAVVRMSKGVGEFVTRGEPLLAITTEATDETKSRLNGMFSLGHHRTIDQDSAFGVRQIVDIALKALSPGVNDVTTAIVSLDYLGTILARMARRRTAAWKRGTNGDLRVIGRGATFESLADDAFDQIRDAARDNAAIYLRMLDTIGTVAAQTCAEERRRVLAAHVDRTQETALRCLQSERNRSRLRSRVAEVKATLKGEGEGAGVREVQRF
ncbi:MAG: DUF2254 domain-containing protein [Vicinamibacterales bacterium]